MTVWPCLIYFSFTWFEDELKQLSWCHTSIALLTQAQHCCWTLPHVVHCTTETLNRGETKCNDTLRWVWRNNKRVLLKKRKEKTKWWRGPKLARDADVEGFCCPWCNHHCLTWMLALGMMYNIHLIPWILAMSRNTAVNRSRLLQSFEGWSLRRACWEYSCNLWLPRLVYRVTPL